MLISKNYNKHLIILGIDPGTIKTGFGIISKQGNVITHIHSGVIRMNSKLPLPERLKLLHLKLIEIIEKFKPDVAAIEDIFSAKYPKSGIYLGHSRGVVLLTLNLMNIATNNYSPRLIKKIVVGYGGAQKKQISKMVSMLLNLLKPPPEDASDALAVAICHAMNHGRDNM